MTEAEWLACYRSQPLLSFVVTQSSWRKFTLYHAACCCSFISDWEDGHPMWDCVSVVEACVDNPVVRSDDFNRLLESDHQARRKLWQLIQLADGVRSADVLNASTTAVASLLLIATFDEGAGEVGQWWEWGGMTADGLMAEQVALTWTRLEQVCDANTARLRDIFGNPFRPVAFASEWRSDNAVSLAQQMYESRDFIAMPILADALQDAGCDNDDILNHCRDANGVHVRGCWVVDLVLGKE